MSNVIPLHGEGSWPQEIRRLEQLNAVYREAILGLCDYSDSLLGVCELLIDPFRRSEVEKTIDRGRELVGIHRAMVSE